jgi:hypothetical protein
VLDKVNATIAGVQKFAGVVQQLTHNNTVSARFEFPALVSEKSVVYDELQRIHNNLMAQKICDQAFDYANLQGVDLKNLDADGKVKKAVAPAPAQGPLAPKLPAGSVFAPPPAPAHAPAGGIKAAAKEVFDEDDVARLATKMDRLEQLAASDMKSEVDIAVKNMVVAVPKALPKATFWWDGDNNKGYQPMTGDDLARTILGSAHGAYGVFEASVTVSQIPGGAMGGMPQDVKYFQLKPNEVKYNPLWITGGGIDVHQHEDVSVSVTSTPDENLYGGAYRVKSTWKWDESTTFFDCNVTNFGASFTGIQDPDPQGVADDGWV